MSSPDVENTGRSSPPSDSLPSIDLDEIQRFLDEVIPGKTQVNLLDDEKWKGKNYYRDEDLVFIQPQKCLSLQIKNYQTDTVLRINLENEDEDYRSDPVYCDACQFQGPEHGRDWTLPGDTHAKFAVSYRPGDGAPLVTYALEQPPPGQERGNPYAVVTFPRGEGDCLLWLSFRCVNSCIRYGGSKVPGNRRLTVQVLGGEVKTFSLRVCKADRRDYRKYKRTRENEAEKRQSSTEERSTDDAEVSMPSTSTKRLKRELNPSEIHSQSIERITIHADPSMSQDDDFVVMDDNPPLLPPGEDKRKEGLVVSGLGEKRLELVRSLVLELGGEVRRLGGGHEAVECV